MKPNPNEVTPEELDVADVPVTENSEDVLPTEPVDAIVEETLDAVPEPEPEVATQPAPPAPEVDPAQIIAALEAKVSENLNLAKYQKAEFENYKRRNKEAVAMAFQDGQAHIVNLLLPIYDGVVEAGKKIADPVDLAGFEIIRKKLDDLFAQLGIEAINTVEQPFDPNFHNAVAVEAVEGVAPDIVLEEWQKGFLWHGRVLRPAMVKVSGTPTT